MTTPSSSNRFDLMSRRRFTEVLTGLGVSTAVAPYVSREAAAEMQDRDTVVRVSGLINDEPVNGNSADIGVPPESLPGDKRLDPGPNRTTPAKERMKGRKAILKPIPIRKWEIVEAVRDARSQMYDLVPAEWTENREYITIRVETGVEDPVSNSSDPGSRFVAPVYPVYNRETENGTEQITPSVSFDTFRDQFPSTVTGVAGRGTYLETEVSNIPVVPKKKEVDLHAYYDYEYRPVPSGCIFGTGADASATLGVRADDYNNDQFVILTAAHIFKEIVGWSFEAHQPVWLSTSDEYKIGYTDGNRRVNQNDFDAVVVTGLSANTTRKFAENDGTLQDQYPVRGIITNSEIDDNAGNQNYELTKQGVATGRTSGYISGWDGSIVSIRASGESGDSGGPWFREYENTQQDYTYSLVAGIHKGSSGTSINATAIENIESRFNVNVGV